MTIIVRYARIISVLAVIMLVNPIINSGVSAKGLASNSNSTSTGNNTNAPQVIFNDKPNHICLDGDAQYEAYWKGFTDGMHDEHHIKRTGVTWFNDSSAETDYHNGYQKGWADAKVNGTMLDESCWTR